MKSWKEVFLESLAKALLIPLDVLLLYASIRFVHYVYPDLTGMEGPYIALVLWILVRRK